jgi:hypothetical protein
MKEIKLTRGQVALVDDRDYDLLSQKTWTAVKTKTAFYAAHYYRDDGKIRSIHMHRFLLNPLPGLVIDHIDGNPLNNRRSNLRIATYQQNLFNQRGRTKHGFKGVRDNNSLKNPFVAFIADNGKIRHIGVYPTAELAAMAYDRRAIELRGEFAFLNFPKNFAK